MANKFFDLAGEKDKISEEVRQVGSLKGKVPLRVNDRTVIWVHPDKVEERKRRYGLK